MMSMLEVPHFEDSVILRETSLLQDKKKKKKNLQIGIYSAVSHASWQHQHCLPQLSVSTPLGDEYSWRKGILQDSLIHVTAVSQVCT